MALHASLAQIVADPKLPTLPALAMRVIHKASQPDCTIAEIASLVGRDPALCARILKIVNSAFFSIPRAVTSIDRALHLLGLRRVRSLILGLSLPSIQHRSKAHPWIRDFWKASVAAAIAAHEWATINGSSDPDDYLVCSLLCDLGAIVLLEMYPTQYAEVLSLTPDAFIREQCDLERKRFGFDHAEVSAALLKSWGFPEEMTEAIRHHHNPERLQGSPAAVARVHDLAFATKIGQLQLAPDQPALFLELMNQARNLFNLDQQGFIRFLEPLEKKVEELAGLLNVDIGTFHHYPTLLANAAGQLAQLASETALDNIRVSEEKSHAESECRRGEEALEQLGRKHELILNAAGEGIYGLDMEGKITFANVAAARMLGWRSEDLIRVPTSALFTAPGTSPVPLPWSLAPLRGVLIEGQTQHVEDGTFWKKNGSSFPVAFTCAPVREKEKLVGAVVTFRDMTEHRRLEEQYRQARKMEAVGRLAGGVAHDFNNLLTIILGCGELLMMPGVIPDRAHRLVAEISKAGKQAAELTRQLLAFSRQQVLAPKILKLNDVIKDVEKLLRRLIGEDITLTSVLDSALGLVKADPGQLEQVIMNLAVNARDAMPHGGCLTFETASVDLREISSPEHQDVAPGQYALLSVMDTGCGMDAATQSHLFEPFFTTKEPGKGTGLGLATVYGIVKQSGGFINVYSKVGLGSCFKIYLPLVHEQATPREAAPSHESSPRGTETILVVEDEPGVRELVRQLLQDAGYKVLHAGHGVEALGICRQYAEPIDLLLTDVVMPQMSAKELAEAVLHQRPEIKVLFMSGYTDDRVIREGILSAEIPFLQKPFTPVALAQKVREVLDQTPALVAAEV